MFLDEHICWFLPESVPHCSGFLFLFIAGFFLSNNLVLFSRAKPLPQHLAAFTWCLALQCLRQPPQQCTQHRYVLICFLFIQHFLNLFICSYCTCRLLFHLLNCVCAVFLTKMPKECCVLCVLFSSSCGLFANTHTPPPPFLPASYFLFRKVL